MGPQLGPRRGFFRSLCEAGVFWYVFGGGGLGIGHKCFDLERGGPLGWRDQDRVGGVLGFWVGPEDLSGSRCDAGGEGFDVERSGDVGYCWKCRLRASNGQRCEILIKKVLIIPIMRTFSHEEVIKRFGL